MENTESQTFGHANTGLTEEFVKQRFVPFLKDFYRHRYEPMPDSISVDLDNVSEGGLVADILMTFRKNDGTPFVCSCEATSRDKAGEAKFTLNLVYFLWDAAAFGAVCSAAAYAFFYKTQMKWLLDLHLTGNLGLIIGTFTIAFFGWYFTMQNWRKYRYIYSIEQFKRYEADEQWVALADDVFPSPNDPYLTELKNQCVYNRFGLALVPAEGPVRVLNAPSRLGDFGKSRKMVHWVTRSQWYQAVSQNVTNMGRFRPPDMVHAWWNQVKSSVQYLVTEPFKKYVWGILSRPFGQTASVYNRFMSGQTVQKWVFALSSLALVPMCWQVLSFTETDTADLEKLQRWEGGINPEDQPGYVLDGAPIPYDGKPTGVPKQYPISKNAPETEVQTIDLSGDSDEEEEVPTINLSGDEEEEAEEKPAKKTAPKPSKPKPATSVSTPCGGLSGKKGWVVQDNAFTLQDYAAARAASLKAKGIAAQSTARSCFEPGEKGYIVWLGTVQASEEAARKAATSLEKTLSQKGLGKKKLLVRKLP